MPASASRVCRPSARAKVLASDREAVVFSAGAAGFFGCLKALGRPRRLLQASTDSIVGVIAVRLAGRFAVLEHESGNQYGGEEGLTLYDLGSGHTTALAEIQTVTNWQPTLDKFDSMALNSSGFAAWRETSSPEPIQIPALSCPSVSLCVAGDFAGRILSSSDPAGGSAPWSFAPVLSSGLTGVPISGVSCPSISLCVAIDGASVLTSTAPDGGTAAWTNSTPVESLAPLAGGLSQAS